MIVRLLPILGITFIDILGFSILLPLMPYYVQHFGAPVIVVGALLSVFAACQFIAGPLWGNLSDRIGRKRVLIISQIGATIGWTMLAFAPNIAIVFVARIIEGLSGGNLSVTQAYVGDLVPSEKRGRAFAYVGASFSGGLIFGPLIGGVLFARFGYTAPFLAAAALQVLTLAVTIAILPESRKPGDERTPTLRDIVTELTDPRVAPILWQKLVLSLGLYGWFAAFILVLQRQLGLDAANSSYLFGVFGAVSVVLQLGVVARFVDALGARRASNIGFVSLVGAFVIASFMHDYLTTAVMIVLFALGMALENAAIPTLLSDAAPENVRGTVLGVGSSLENISGVVMPPITTGVFGRYGVVPTAGISAAFAIVALVMGIMQANLRPPRAATLNEERATP